MLALNDLGEQASVVLRTEGRTKRKIRPGRSIIINSCRDIDESAINFIVAPRAVLASTNFPLLGQPLSKSLKNVLDRPKSIVPQTKVWHTIDYVEVVSSTSFLSALQTALYQIKPIVLRNQTNDALILWMNGQLSDRKLQTILTKSLGQEDLAELMKSKRARDLRAAVEASSTIGVAASAARSGFPVFDLSYLVSKYARIVNDQNDNQGRTVNGRSPRT